jgi:hypothetical protein
VAIGFVLWRLDFILHLLLLFFSRIHFYVLEFSALVWLRIWRRRGLGLEFGLIFLSICLQGLLDRIRSLSRREA